MVKEDKSLKNFDYSVKRVWTWNSDSINEQVIVIQNGVTLSEDEVLNFQNYLIHLIPPEMLKLYFFDGEKIADYFLEKKEVNIRDALMILSGNDTFDILYENVKGEMVKAKKYFYVLRPVLACNWVLNRQTPPPMLFDELAAAELPEVLKADVDRLLDLKMNSPEVKEIPRIDALNEYLDREIILVKNRIKELAKEQNNSWQALDDLFLKTLDAYN